MKARLEPLCRALTLACTEVYARSLVSVVLFGSWARGTATPESDVDVMVVADDLPCGRARRMAQFRAVEEKVEAARPGVWGTPYDPPQLSPFLKTPDEVSRGSPLFLDMTDGSVLLHDKGRFFQGYLDGLRGRMRKHGTRRVAAKGGYYWLYSPDARPGQAVEL